MKLLYLDFETYYDQEYSLKKMTPPEYILGPKFETICCACAVDDEKSYVVDGPQFGEWLSQFNPDDTATVTFNALFDNAILAWRYGFVPKMMYDTMAMARALHGHEIERANLRYLLEFFKAPMAKGTEIDNMVGVTHAHLQTDLGKRQRFWDYANTDNEGNRWLFERLLPAMPESEQRLANLVLRAGVIPRFMCDTPMLREHVKQVRLDKETMLKNCGILKKDVMSAVTFQKLLEALGVEIKYKASPSRKDDTGEPVMIPAFGKSDAFMEELQEHPDERVQLLAAARLGNKSTLEETRTEKFIRIGELPWAVTCAGGARLYKGGGTMPVPLRYGGAHTHRLSGEWKMNLQNLPTARGSKGKSKLRQSLLAPPGWCVIVADLGQIEARLGAWITRCETLNTQFAQKLDPYNRLASKVFGREVNRKLAGTPDEIMGFIGKTGILGLGYGAGPERFLGMVLAQARSSGIDLSTIGGFDIDKAKATVDAYRGEYWQIKTNGWDELNKIIKTTWAGKGGRTEVGFGPDNVVVIGKGYVMPPSMLPLRYHNPRVIEKYLDTKTYDGIPRERDIYGFDYYGETHKIYGAKFLENIVQYLARIIVMNAALRLAGRGYEFVLQAHDELVFIVPLEDRDNAKQIIHTEMTRRPSWARDLPLTADVNHGASYGEAK